MICRHCQQPIQRCNWTIKHDCKGWTHARNSLHPCEMAPVYPPTAEPEPGTLPATEAPTSKPSREVA